MRKSFSTTSRRRRKKMTSFNPDHADVTKATEEFLKKGGNITRIEDIHDEFESFITHREVRSPADDFLMGS